MYLATLFGTDVLQMEAVKVDHDRFAHQLVASVGAWLISRGFPAASSESMVACWCMIGIWWWFALPPLWPH